ncbi:UDPGT domain-containing protein [Cephalotus follicularis]|uniref:UDPGT domain-containing protein n=1 Tax=Cephalotus follicularis TaxID=3775 RepID=A0A1Q3CQ53_CEPFO|nr:UDPGT domain-containing protein [Cephalotus follicularis]
MSTSNSSTATTKKRPHILIFPYPAHGHTLSLLDLTHQLSLQNLTITILVTPKNLPTLSPLLSINPSIQTLTLLFPSHPKLPPGVENVKDLGPTGNVAIISALAQLFDPIIAWFNSHPNPPVAIVSDFFLGWTLHLANKMGIPRLAFFSVGALLASVSDFCWNNIVTVSGCEHVSFPCLPRSPVFKEEHLPSVFRLYREGDPDWELVKDGMLANTLSYGCVFNSFHALEGEYLDWVKLKMGQDRVFGVGPLSLVGPEYSWRGSSDPSNGGSVLTWLDGCLDGSVLYVCFGSQKLLNREQMEALASGLDKSGGRFVWVVKPGGTTRQVEDGYGVVPDGFEERVAGRGFVIRGWAQQVKILGHSAVGGFLSHCGWNSLMEGIVAGVMIMAWPMEADQFVNAKLLVEDMGVAVRICEGADSVPDSDKLGRVIREALSEGGVQVREKAKELRDEALAAVRAGGSSKIDLDRLVNEFVNLKSV